MIGMVKGTTRQMKQVAGLPAPIASFRSNASGVKLDSLKVLVEAVQSGSGTPSPDNVRPITGWSGANVTRTGNLIDYSSCVAGYLSYTGVFTNPTSAKEFLSDYIEVTPSSSLNFTAYIDSTSEKWTAFAWYKEDKTFISRTGYNDTDKRYSRTVTVPNNAYYVRIMWRNYSDTISSVVAYNNGNGNTYTISFGDTYYGGELDVTNGVLRVTHQITKIKDLSWTYQSNYIRFYSASIKNTVLPATSGTDIPNGLMCESYEPHTFNSSSNGQVYIDTIGNIFIKDFNYTDTTAWFSAVGEYLIRYPLATPFTIQLSPQQIEQLLGDNNVFADCGEISELKYQNRIITKLFSKG